MRHPVIDILSLISGEYIACLLLFSGIPSVGCLTCLKCDSTIKPSLCRDVEQCGPHEVCQTEAFVTASGSVTYKVGCVDTLLCVSAPTVGKRDIIHSLNSYKLSSSSDSNRQAIKRDKRDVKFCSECCEGKLCNAGGCGNKGFETNLGPICYSCPTQIGSAGCEHIEQCGRDKICMINPKTVPGETDTYTSSCEHQRDCTSVQLPIGGGAYACSACCNQSLCNSFNTSADICNYQLNTVTSTSVAYKSTVNSHSLTTTWKTSGGTSTTTHSSSAPTTHSTPSASTRTTSATQADCTACARFHPEIVCSTNTSFVRGCVEHCGWHCS